MSSVVWNTISAVFEPWAATMWIRFISRSSPTQTFFGSPSVRSTESDALMTGNGQGSLNSGVPSGDFVQSAIEASASSRASASASSTSNSGAVFHPSNSG